MSQREPVPKPVLSLGTQLSQESCDPRTVAGGVGTQGVTAWVGSPAASLVENLAEGTQWLFTPGHATIPSLYFLNCERGIHLKLISLLLSDLSGMKSIKHSAEGSDQSKVPAHGS